MAKTEKVGEQVEVRCPICGNNQKPSDIWGKISPEDFVIQVTEQWAGGGRVKKGTPREEKVGFYRNDERSKRMEELFSDGEIEVFRRARERLKEEAK